MNLLQIKNATPVARIGMKRISEMVIMIIPSHKNLRIPPTPPKIGKKLGEIVGAYSRKKLLG
jgi:hypothetical protein